MNVLACDPSSHGRDVLLQDNSARRRHLVGSSPCRISVLALFDDDRGGKLHNIGLRLDHVGGVVSLLGIGVNSLQVWCWPPTKEYKGTSADVAI